MDDETAEIELVWIRYVQYISTMLKIFKLEQNLNKTHQISVRMTGTVLLRILRIAAQYFFSHSEWV